MNERNGRNGRNERNGRIGIMSEIMNEWTQGRKEARKEGMKE